MWEAFHEFVEKGKEPHAGAPEALAQVEILREVLKTLVEADGRSLEADPETDTETEGAAQDTSPETKQDTAPEPAPGPAPEAAPAAVPDAHAGANGPISTDSAAEQAEDAAESSAEGTSVRIGPLAPSADTGEIPPAAPTEDLSSVADQLEVTPPARAAAAGAETSGGDVIETWSAGAQTGDGDGDAWAAAADDAAKDGADDDGESPRS
jgi:hypothetical protein